MCRPRADAWSKCPPTERDSSPVSQSYATDTHPRTHRHTPHMPGQKHKHLPRLVSRPRPGAGISETDHQCSASLWVLVGQGSAGGLTGPTKHPAPPRGLGTSRVTITLQQNHNRRFLLRGGAGLGSLRLRGGRKQTLPHTPHLEKERDGFPAASSDTK